VLGGERVEESLSLCAMDRVVKSFVGPFGGPHAPPFHVSAALEYRWDASLNGRMRAMDHLTPIT
jgi:hypothetical protein